MALTGTPGMVELWLQSPVPLSPGTRHRSVTGSTVGSSLMVLPEGLGFPVSRALHGACIGGRTSHSSPPSCGCSSEVLTRVVQFPLGFRPSLPARGASLRRQRPLWGPQTPMHSGGPAQASGSLAAGPRGPAALGQAWLSGPCLGSQTCKLLGCCGSQLTRESRVGAYSTGRGALWSSLCWDEAGNNSDHDRGHRLHGEREARTLTGPRLRNPCFLASLSASWGPAGTSTAQVLV